MTTSISQIVCANTIPGGKKFSKNLTPLDADGNPISMWGVRQPLSPPLSIPPHHIFLNANLLCVLGRKRRQSCLLIRRRRLLVRGRLLR